MHEHLPSHVAATARFTADELRELSVADDIKLCLTHDFHPDIPDGGHIARSAFPTWQKTAEGPQDGPAIAVWQMLFPADRTRRIGCGDTVFPPATKWLWAPGISYFRGWIRHAGPDGPDFVIDWVAHVRDDVFEVIRDGDAGPFSPPPGCELQTFLDAVTAFSNDSLLRTLNTWFGPDGVMRDRLNAGRNRR